MKDCERPEYTLEFLRGGMNHFTLGDSYDFFHYKELFLLVFICSWHENRAATGRSANAPPERRVGNQQRPEGTRLRLRSRLG